MKMSGEAIQTPDEGSMFSCITVSSTDDDAASKSALGRAGGVHHEPQAISLPDSPLDVGKKHVGRRRVDAEEITLPDEDDEEEETETAGRLRLSDSEDSASQNATLPDIKLNRTFTSTLRPEEIEIVTLSSASSPPEKESDKTSAAPVTSFDAGLDRRGIHRATPSPASASKGKRGRPAKRPYLDPNNNIIEHDDLELNEADFERVSPEWAAQSVSCLVEERTVKSLSDGHIRGKELDTSFVSCRSYGSQKSEGKHVRSSRVDDEQSSSQERRVLRARPSLLRVLSSSSRERSSSRDAISRLQASAKSVSTPERSSLAREPGLQLGFKPLSLNDVKLVEFKPVVRLCRLKDDVFQYYQESWGREASSQRETPSLSDSPPAKKASPSVSIAPLPLESAKKRHVEPPEIFDENTNFFNDDQETTTTTPVAAKKLDLSVKKSVATPAPETSTSGSAEKKTTPTRETPAAKPDEAKPKAPKRPQTDEPQLVTKKAKLAEPTSGSTKTTVEKTPVVAGTTPKPVAKPADTKTLSTTKTTTTTTTSSTVKLIKKKALVAASNQTPRTTKLLSTATTTSVAKNASSLPKTPTAKLSLSSFKIPKLLKKTAAPVATTTTTTGITTEKSKKATNPSASLSTPVPASEPPKTAKTPAATTVLPATVSNENNKKPSGEVYMMSRRKASAEAAALKAEAEAKRASPRAAAAQDDGFTTGRSRQEAIESLNFGRPLTIREHNEKRNQFNKSLNCMHPYFSFGYLFQDYLDEMKLVPSLDVNLLQSTLADDPRDPISVKQLANEHQLELCRLMSRNAGAINYYRLAGFGSDLRGPSAPLHPNNDRLLQELHAVGDDFKRLEFVLNNFNTLTLAEAYALYKAYQTKLNSPYRQITVFNNPHFDAKAITSIFGRFDIKIETQNNGCIIPDLNAPIEEVVSFALHKQQDSYSDKVIRASLFKSVAPESSRKEAPGSSTAEPKDNSDLTYYARIKKVQELINDKHTFDNLFVNNIYRRNSGVKCPQLKTVASQNLTSSSYLQQCRSMRIKPPKVDTSGLKRFVNYQPITNDNRGDMQRANKFRILTTPESQRILSELQANESFKRLNLMELFGQKKRQ